MALRTSLRAILEAVTLADLVAGQLPVNVSAMAQEYLNKERRRGRGHRTHAITLPGPEPKDADRSGIALRDVAASSTPSTRPRARSCWPDNPPAARSPTPRSAHGPLASSTSAASYRPP